MTNRLAASASPYLLQHADNPVDWWEWGPDALAEARRREVPVLLSVGYAACHWCHVMAHESFEDATTAAQMNEGFVNVKVDREERPDVDAVYMAATQAMTGSGGWPMTAFLTPAGEPFYCGTYFPPQPRAGAPSFGQLLSAVSLAWQERRAEVVQVSREVTRRLGALPALDAEGPPGVGDLDTAVQLLAADFDGRYGGFGGAPKFPTSPVLEFLLRHAARTGSPDAAHMAAATLEAMARSGTYDQLGGGFARYAVDRAWVVPHFEKMLYDNAQLLRVYAHWWRAGGGPTAERVVRETAAFLLRDLRTPEGGFASALDADAEGVEGLTYVWSPAQLEDVLGPDDGSWAAQLLGVSVRGTFEHGSSTLQLVADADDPARWARVRAALLRERSRRPQPARDDKVVAAWNGLAVAALADAGALLAEPEWVAAAAAAADLLVGVHLDDHGRLLRVSRTGVAGRHAGVLEDHGDVAEGFLALYAATGDPSWLALSEGLLEQVLARFADGSGRLHDTAVDAEPLISRPRDPTDNAYPAGTTAAAGALLSFAALTGSSRHRDAAEAALAPVRVLATRAPRFAGWGLAVAEALLAGPLEVAVVGPPAHPATRALVATAWRARSPGAVVAWGDPGDPASTAVPLLRDRPLLDGAPAAYVCRHLTCAAPTADATRLAAQVQAD